MTRKIDWDGLRGWGLIQGQYPDEEGIERSALEALRMVGVEVLSLSAVLLAAHDLAEGVKGEIRAREQHGSGSIEHSSARLRTARALAEWRVVTGEVQ